MSKQIVKSVLCLLGVALAVSAGGSSVSAQTSPPISPWLGMFDLPSNPTLGNYLGNVRPQQNLMRSSASQASQIQSQQRALQELLRTPATGSGGVPSGERNLGSATSIASTTGGAASARDVLAPPREIPRMQKNPAGFDQYLHYYPMYSMQRKPVPNFSSTGRRR